MTFRTLYAIKEAWIFSNQLKHYMVDSNLQLENVITIDVAYLQARGVQGLILDYDGVLAAHGELIPRPEILQWLQNLIRAYAPHKIYILSNKPLAARIEYFAQHFPEVIFVKPIRKKPYPDGLQQIISMSGLSVSQLMLADDRLCTGILSTLIARVQGCWITKPYINLNFKPLAEIGVMFMRCIDRLMIKFFAILH